MLEKLKEIIARIIPETDVSTVNENTRLIEDLKFDSLNMAMLCIELEEAFGFRFSQLVHFETVSDICGYLDCRI